MIMTKIETIQYLTDMMAANTYEIAHIKLNAQERIKFLNKQITQMRNIVEDLKENLGVIIEDKA